MPAPAPTPLAIARFTVLGAVTSGLDGRDTTPRQAQQRTLLARLLAAAGEVVSVEALNEALWPRQRPASADKALHVLVGRVRAAVAGGDGGSGLLAREVDGYRIDTARCELDAATFDDLVRRARTELGFGWLAEARASFEAAAALWRGRPFEEHADASWAAAPRMRLEARRIAAAAEHARLLLSVDDAAAALDSLDAALELAPLDQQLLGLRIRALAQVDSPAAAQVAFAAVRSELLERTGLEPGPELQEALQSPTPATPLDVRPSETAAPEPPESARELASWLEAVGEQPLEEVVRWATRAGSDEVDVLDDLEALLVAGMVGRRTSDKGVVLLSSRGAS